MIDSVRSEVGALLHQAGLMANENISLAFNRLCPGIDSPGEEPEAKENALKMLINGYSEDSIALYRHSFNARFEAAINDPNAICLVLSTAAPLVIGKGDQNVHEFGLTFNLPWGTPVLPGSAIKGVLSSYAHEAGGEDWQKGILGPFAGKHSLLMFGGTNQEGAIMAGCIDFLDAWWIPEERHPFAEDIINVHYRSYYQNSKAWPDGTDSPVPNKFITIRPGQRFLFVLRGNESWRDLAADLLKNAAHNKGFGSKTRVGYGRMENDDSALEGLKNKLQQQLRADIIRESPWQGLMPGIIEIEAWGLFKTRVLDGEEHAKYRHIEPFVAAIVERATFLRERWKKTWEDDRDALVASWLEPTGIDWHSLIPKKEPVATFTIEEQAAVDGIVQLRDWGMFKQRNVDMAALPDVALDALRAKLKEWGCGEKKAKSDKQKAWKEIQQILRERKG